MEISLWGVIAATIVQFVVGMVWYTGIFGKLWGVMHGFDKISKEKQKEMMSQMAPFYVMQLLVTFFTAMALAKFGNIVPNYSLYDLTIYAWLGFVIPVQYSAVAFGGTEPKWIAKKMLIMSFGTLACLLAGAWVLQMV